MSENGWTPGPYVYGRREPHCKITAIAHCGDFVIGPDSNYEGGNYRDTEIGSDEDDARLLAAAPALASVAENTREAIINWIDLERIPAKQAEPVLDAIDAALALAKGQRS